MNNTVPQTGLRVSIDPRGQELSVSIGDEVTRLKLPGTVRKRAQVLNFGAVAVRLLKTAWYSKRHRKKYFSWTLAWRDIQGRRRREKRSSLELAKKRAAAIAQDIQSGEAVLGNFGQAQRAALARAQELLAPIGSPPVEIVAGIYAESVQMLRAAGITDLSPADAVRFLIENRPRGIVAKNVPQAIEEMLEQMELAEEGERWIDDLRSRLSPSAKKWKQPVKPFGEQFSGPLNTLRAEALNAWLGALKLSPRSRNNYRGAVLALVAFAKEKKYLPRAWSEMEDVKVEKIKTRRILIYTPQECALMLRCARPNILPFMAIQAFAGIRSRELTGDSQHEPLKWSDVRLKQRSIHVPADVAKEGTPERIVPMPENLAAWLAPYARRSGSDPVCQCDAAKALRRTADRAGVTFIRNGLRKSFISYRLAILGDIGRVADEAGNSPAKIRSNYRDVREKQEAERWFNVGTLQLRLSGIDDDDQARA